MAEEQDGASKRSVEFDPDNLNRSLLSIPLIEKIKQAGEETIDIIIDANLDYPGGRQEAREQIKRYIKEKIRRPEALSELKNRYSQQYVFATLSGDEIVALAQVDLALHSEASPAKGPAPRRAIYKIWLDHPIKARTNKSVSTVKADAARTAFGTLGSDIIWAVLDTGVDGQHPHFKTHGTLDLEKPLQHLDFTALDGSRQPKERPSALVDVAGHGTHVAGIIAGEFIAGRQNPVVAADPPVAAANAIIMEMRKFEENGDKTTYKVRNETGAMGGMAPRAKILSLKVLDDDGEGKASNIIAALEYIQELNSHGRRLLVHGVNLSVGYGFEPAWFACGQSPVCVEVNRTVASGVVVVAAAGNTGYGYNQPMSAGPRAAGLDITINDPGNAEDAITVGSTHRDMPHVYGISYFSSKGPTGDGRLKPDLVAPGERILSCSSGDKPGAPATEEKASDGSTTILSQYVEDSGTSMAAPHVSGVIAAFLSARREFIGQPLKVKSIFMKTATDLGRERYFQGSGLVDLMRAIQSV